jgi:undecaprenyl phosphate-alpha-L-ara4N flippase subunit ArnF
MMSAPARLRGIALLATSILLSSVGQLCMRAGMLELRESPAASFELTRAAIAAIEQPLLFVAGGLLAYAASMLVWLAVLVRYPLSYAYPFLSLSYVLVYVGATQWDRLMESATPLRTAGTILILAGVALVSRSEHGTGR